MNPSHCEKATKIIYIPHRNSRGQMKEGREGGGNGNDGRRKGGRKRTERGRKEGRDGNGSEVSLQSTAKEERKYMYMKGWGRSAKCMCVRYVHHKGMSDAQRCTAFIIGFLVRN